MSCCSNLPQGKYLIGSNSERRWAVRLLMIGACVLFLNGCAKVLPRSSEVIESPFPSFEATFAAFQTVRNHATSQQQLGEIGFNNHKIPNIEILNYLDLIERFMPRESIRIEDLDQSLQNCIRAQTACIGYLAMPGHINKERVGNVFLDVFDFKRTEVLTGWSAEALFVIHDNTVVYKLWSGKPVISETRQSIKPLGPIQNLGSAVNSAVKGAFD